MGTSESRKVLAPVHLSQRKLVARLLYEQHPYTKIRNYGLRRTCSKKLYEHIGNKEDKIGENTNFCVLSSINLAHNGHVLEETGSEQKTLTKVQELLSSYDLSKKLTNILSIQPGGKGLLANASIYMEQAAPEIHIPGNILKNAIDRLRGNSYDAQQFVNMLLDDCKNNKKFEFVNYGRDDDSGVLTYAAWAFKGSRSVVQR